MLNQIALADAANALRKEEKPFKVLFEHGTLSVELYKPDKVDNQNPHERDEVYVIAAGSGQFILEGEITEVKAGDFLFVPAGAYHKFINFTADFSTWVLFYGPSGGEKGMTTNYL
ncbi:cupin domain-containing protein [Adhaeribacter aquaticus]|uniref:cupin domain-containing protein n=1 Tax=Adhaeribacter aquaticus TaxID=299567 RepID=UPI0004236E8E|nr:cupin domain-containing protein [Adhaeribacter aquaticus]